MRFLGVPYRLFDAGDRYWVHIDGHIHFSSFDHEKGTIEDLKKYILRTKHRFKPRWKKAGVDCGADYYLDEAPFHFSIKKIENSSKVIWDFTGWEKVNSQYTPKYCRIICNTLKEAKQQVFNAYKFMSQDNILHTKLDSISEEFKAMTTDVGPDKGVIRIHSWNELNNYMKEVLIDEQR